ncbi:hypothetical protein FZC71_01120 [Bacillus subtilis]|nr:hypothetical protein FZC71_01120 [Bacillus subtilis]
MDILKEIIQLREKEQALNGKGFEQDAGRNTGTIIAYRPLDNDRHRFLGINLHGWNITISEKRTEEISGEPVEIEKDIEKTKLSDQQVVDLINGDDFTIKEMNRLINNLKARNIFKD